MSKPRLYVFSISHYCEKARWAIEHHGIEYELVHLAPGSHISTARDLGSRRSGLPILSIDGEVIQGSSKIIDWADRVGEADSKRLAPQGGESGAEIEKRLDDVLGVHARRVFYSEALVEQPQSVRRFFARDLSLVQRLTLRAAWGKIRQKMIQGMDLGTSQGAASQQLVEKELDWLDALLSDGRSFLVGDRFSRVDLTAASLMSPLVRPEEHPSYARLELPPRLSTVVREWDQRRTTQWVREIYAEYR